MAGAGPLFILAIRKEDRKKRFLFPDNGNIPFLISQKLAIFES
jgi:hypothetical protein